MQIGTFNLVQKRHPKVPAEETFRDLLEDTQLAEDIGMDQVWIAEHHFSSYGLSVSPLMTASWLAGRTRRIRLAPGVLVLPLYEPLRLVQEYEMLSLMSDDRIDFGIGTGYQGYEFERFRVPLSEAGDRSLEIMDIFHQVIDTGRVNYNGKFYQIPDTGIAVRAHKTTPTVFMAAALKHPKLPQLALKRGYVPMLSPGWGRFQQVVEQREFYDSLAREEGVDPANVPLTLMRFVHVTDSRDDALKAAEAFRYSTRAASAFRFNYAEFDGDAPRDIPARDEPSLDEIIENTIIGDAETCAEKIIKEAQEVRATHYACMMNVGGMSRRMVTSSLEKMGSDVMPAVRAALPRNSNLLWQKTRAV